MYEFDLELEELMDNALSELSHKTFIKFLDDISMIISDYEDKAETEVKDDKS